MPSPCILLAIRTSIHLVIDASIYPVIHPSKCQPCTHLLIHLSMHPSVHLCMNPPIRVFFSCLKGSSSALGRRSCDLMDAVTKRLFGAAFAHLLLSSPCCASNIGRPACRRWPAQSSGCSLPPSRCVHPAPVAEFSLGHHQPNWRAKGIQRIVRGWSIFQKDEPWLARNHSEDGNHPKQERE